MDNISVAEHICRQVAVQLVAVVLLDIVLLGLIPRHERAVRHVVHLFQLGLQVPGLCLRQGVVHEGHHRVLLLEIR